MTIVAVKQTNGKEVTPEQIEKDLPKLKKLHEKAMKQEALWKFFGGFLTVEDREYQVM